jgi:hypothetical protein
VWLNWKDSKSGWSRLIWKRSINKVFSVTNIDPFCPLDKNIESSAITNEPYDVSAWLFEMSSLYIWVKSPSEENLCVNCALTSA